MISDDLETVLNGVTELERQTPAIKRLGFDLLNEYYQKLGVLTIRERQAWDDLLEKRLVWLGQHDAGSAVTPLLAVVRAKREGKDNIRQIHFGQLRAAAHYQSAATIHSVEKVAGKTVMEVALELATGEIARDELTIKIFYAAGVWVTVNNRSLAAHSLAAAIPIRLIPCLPSVDERNRLSEVEDLPVAPVDLRIPSDRERFAAMGLELPPAAETMLPATSLPNGRQLPSHLLPLTPGPEDKRVLGVVRSIMA